MRLGVDLRCLQDAVLTGVGEYAWQVLRALAHEANSPEIVGWASGAKPIHLPELPSAKFSLVHSRTPNRLRNLASFARVGPSFDAQLHRAAGTLDALWLPNPSFTHLGGKLPGVLTVHDLSFMHYPEFFSRRGHLWYFPAVKRLLRTLPARFWVAAVSQHTADDVIEQFPNLAGRVRVVAPGVGAEYSQAQPEFELARVRTKYGLPENFILSLGTIEPRKNYQLLVRAYDELLRREPSYPYDLVIAGTWGWRSRSLRALLGSAPCRSRIHVLGYVSAEDKPALYQAAHLFMYPSFYEGFGIPVLEAMASGTPVLVSHSSSLPEVVGVAGVQLDPWQPDAWVESLLWLARDDEARQSLGERGREQSKKYSWARAAGGYLNLFRELA